MCLGRCGQRGYRSDRSYIFSCRPSRGDWRRRYRLGYIIDGMGVGETGALGDQGIAEYGV